MGQILTATIERAVSKGWIPQGESSAVSQRIEAMGSKYGFNPDHFGIFTHIESYGMKPNADNGLGCVGIIQFCPDNQRGSTKTIGGKSYNLQQVKQMSVLQQLDLVDSYLNGVIPSSMRSGLTLDHLYFLFYILLLVKITLI